MREPEGDVSPLSAKSVPRNHWKKIHRKMRWRVQLGELLLPGLKYWLPGALLSLLCVWWLLSIIFGEPTAPPSSALPSPAARSVLGPRAVDVSIIFLIAALSVLLATTIERSRRILVRTLALPEELVNGGWSAEAVAHHVGRGIDRVAGAGVAPAVPLLLDASPRPDIIVPSTTISVATAAAWLGDFLGLRPRCISVELLARGPGRIAIWLRPEPGRPISGDVVPTARLADALASLGEQAAEAVAPYNFTIAVLRAEDQARRDMALTAAQRAGDSVLLPSAVRAACLALCSILTFQRLCRDIPPEASLDELREGESIAREAAQELNRRALALVPDHPLAIFAQALLEQWRPDLEVPERHDWIAQADAVRPLAERYFAENSQLIEKLIEIEDARRWRRWQALGWAPEGPRIAFLRSRLARAQKSLTAARVLLRDMRKNGAPVIASLFMDRVEDALRAIELLESEKPLPSDLAEATVKLRRSMQRLLTDLDRAHPAIEAAQLRYAEEQARYEQSVAYFKRVEDARWSALRAWVEQGDGPPPVLRHVPE